jgi:S-adenosylmethionine decarboxylase
MESYIRDDGFTTWCGEHLLVDIWEPLCGLWADSYKVRTVMERAAEAAGATILHSHFHDFGNGGVSGVVVLQESHISYHSWPENRFIAIDIFMCGRCDPTKALDFIENWFHPGRIATITHYRGIQDKSEQVSC